MTKQEKQNIEEKEIMEQVEEEITEIEDKNLEIEEEKLEEAQT